MICLWGLEQRHAGAIFTGAIFMLQSWSLSLVSRHCRPQLRGGDRVNGSTLSFLHLSSNDSRSSVLRTSAFRHLWKARRRWWHMLQQAVFHSRSSPPESRRTSACGRLAVYWT